jgi:glycosyltransferase involved in cell wall biosynthesis
VLAQTYQEIEIIVVDDGSSDATSAIVEEFVARDARFHLIRQRNAGVGAARNTAIRKARGKYIAPLDADDFWFPEKLEKQVACMEQSGHRTGLVYCRTKRRNAGDMAMLRTAVSRLAQKWSNALIQVLSDEPHVLQAFCPEVTPLPSAGRQCC